MPSRRSISLRKQRSRQFKALMAVGGLALGGVIGVAVKRKVDTVLKTNADIEKKMDDTLANLKQLMARYKTNQKKVVVDVTAESSELEKEVVLLRTQLGQLQSAVNTQVTANKQLQAQLAQMAAAKEENDRRRDENMRKLDAALDKETQEYLAQIKQLTAENTNLKDRLREKEKDEEEAD
jgi:chromosome segregation ATPase